MRCSRVLLGTRTRLLAIDVDGTLLSADGKAPACTFAALDAAEKAGVLCVPATGRCRASCRKAIAAAAANSGYSGNVLGGIEGGVFNGGSLVLHPRGGEPVTQSELPNKEAMAAVRFARDRNLACVTISGDSFACNYGDHAEYVNRLMEMDLNAVTPLELDWPTLEATAYYPLQMVVVTAPPDVIAEIRSEILPIVPSCSVTSPLSFVLDIVPKDGAKGGGLTSLCAALDIPLEEVVVLGDSENDLDMFRVAGTAVAMRTGSEAVKKAATHIVAGPEDDPSGVYEAIHNLVLLS
eukprot:Hpha_TRINITY_DN32340_c0_g1::TRINITY_DN32340_c0_g1_i1::g.145664::m.145664